MRKQRIKILSIHRTNQGGARVDLRFVDARGRCLQRHKMRWQTADELDHFMSLATPQELIRAALREKLGATHGY